MEKELKVLPVIFLIKYTKGSKLNFNPTKPKLMVLTPNSQE